jgi:acyl-CoA dehydrogenase
VEFAYSDKVEEYRENLLDFMDAFVYPNEQTYVDQVGDRHHHPPIMEELKAEARSAGCGTCSCPTRSTARG